MSYETESSAEITAEGRRGGCGEVGESVRREGVRRVRCREGRM